MTRLLRIALLLAIALFMVGTVAVGVGSANTGPFEKVVLLGFGAALIVAATFVQRIGRPHNR